MVRGGGSGLRLLRLSGVPQSIAAFAVLWVGLFVLGRRGGEALPLGHSPRCLAADRQLCRVRRGILLYALWGVGFDPALLAARLQLILHDPQYDFYHRCAAGGRWPPGVERGKIAGVTVGGSGTRLCFDVGAPFAGRRGRRPL